MAFDLDIISWMILIFLSTSYVRYMMKQQWSPSNEIDTSIITYMGLCILIYFTLLEHKSQPARYWRYGMAGRLRTPITYMSFIDTSFFRRGYAPSKQARILARILPNSFPWLFTSLSITNRVRYFNYAWYSDHASRSLLRFTGAYGTRHLGIKFAHQSEYTCWFAQSTQDLLYVRNALQWWDLTNRFYGYDNVHDLWKEKDMHTNRNTSA